MNKKYLMAFVLASGLALAQASGSAGQGTSSSSSPQSTTPSTQTTPSTPNDQNATTSPSSTSNGQETVLRGCLKQSGGNWILSQGGQDVTLNGDSASLRALLQ